MIHISHLKANKDGAQDFPTRPEYQPVSPDIIDGEEQWEVQAILAHKKRYGHLSFLIKWAHHSDDYHDCFATTCNRGDDGGSRGKRGEGA